MNVEIHTVTFGQDIRLFELQAISIDKMLDFSGISKYRVIVNDQNFEDISSRISRFLETEISYSLRRKIELVNASKFIAPGDDGWKDQQYLKLYSVAESLADWVIVLDSKNHFVKDTVIEDFFHNGKAKTYFGHPPPILEPWLRNSLSFFEVDSYANNAMPTVTPYVMRPDLMRLMLNSVRSDKKATDQKNLFQSPALSKTSEFFLYFAFLQKLSCIPDYYAEYPRMCETLYTTWPQDHTVVERLLSHLRDRKYHLFGLHRNRLPQLTDSEKNIIRDIWSPLNLTKDSSYYLTIPD